MIGHEIDTADGEAMVRVVRALGKHRYVASRLHLVHAFAIEAACRGEDPETREALAEAGAWATAVLADPGVDRGSKDERLHRRASDAELVAVLGAFWGGKEGGLVRERARASLARRLLEIGVEAGGAAAAMPLPFDEAGEEDTFPVLVDAGWELLPLRALDAERHKGAIEAFDDELALQVARFEEENTADGEPSLTLHELPIMSAVELMAATDEAGAARAPFVLWGSGHPTYLDYVLRGVLRAARIGE